MEIKDNPVLTKRRIKKIFIEISGRCNALCPYCAFTRIKKENGVGTLMSPAHFSQIIEHLFRIGAMNEENTSLILFNWGEPLLNPNINDILRILKDRNLKAGLSSNFLIAPKVDHELLPVINSVILSLSGFSQENYGRIHGGSLEKVLNNFKNFREELRQHSPQTTVVVNWHRYLFNEDEFWAAHRYFNSLNVPTLPVRAFLNDLVKMRAFIKGELPKEEIAKAKKDVFLDSLQESVNYHKERSDNYYCHQWDQIVIDETGQLLTCCEFSRQDAGSVLDKNILNLSLEEIFNKKSASSLCGECVSSGLARWTAHRDYSYPAGGGVYALKYKSDYYYSKFRQMAGWLIRKLPQGERIISILKKGKKQKSVF